ncbi:MAG: transporter substrate-binding domain-containing protein [Xenococcaceae cyanobacterium MO_167.B27]|nr:transporter substrate-binding domain-containing protein [Xenococcaceae cyanobacterium MO_167.B27]
MINIDASPTSTEEFDFYFGYVEDAYPISSKDTGLFKGYCTELEKYLQEEKKYRFNSIIINPIDRFKQTDKYENKLPKKLAIDCGPNTITPNRSQKLEGIGEFSKPFFDTGSSILINSKAIDNLKTGKYGTYENQDISVFTINSDTFFQNIKLGVLEYTTTQNIINNIYPSLNIKKLDKINKLFKSLSHEDIDGYISDRIILEDYKRRNTDKQTYTIIPENEWLTGLRQFFPIKKG